MMRGLLFTAVALSVPTAAAAQDASYAYAELPSEGPAASGVSGGDREGAVYQAGSITKYACAIAALRLADRNMLDLDATLGDVLPWLDKDAGAARATVRQVLANRSGLPDGLMPAVAEDIQTVLAVGDVKRAMALYVSGDLAAEPGAKFSYDLVNWIAAQAIIEQVTGTPLDEALAELVLRPAGMEHSRVFTGQLGEDGQEPVEPARAVPNFLKCAGGLASTPADLLALQRFANRGGLSEGALAQLRTVLTPEEDYTLGGRFVQTDVGLIDWKTGSNGPYKSVAVYDPATDTGFAAMTATNDWTAIEAARDRWLEKLAGKD